MKRYWVEVPGWGSHGVMARDADEARQRAAGEAHRRGAPHAVLTLGDGSTVSVDAAPCELPRVVPEPDRTDEERDARILDRCIRENIGMDLWNEGPDGGPYLRGGLR